MIEEGDSVAVGVSGGKDSILLLYALHLYRKFSGRDFRLEAITLEMGFEPFDVEPIGFLQANRRFLHSVPRRLRRLC